MALLAITNTLDYAFKIDADVSERDNTYTKFSFAAAETKYIDEADINPFAGESVMAKGLPNALGAGTLTVTEADIDDLTILPVKNFIASGLGIKYYYAGGSVTNKYIVVIDTTTGKVGYDSALGATTQLGVLRKDAVLNDYVRVKTSGSATVVAGETLVVGDYVAGYTDGTAKKVTATGKYYVGVVTTGATVGGDAVITVAPGVIS